MSNVSEAWRIRLDCSCVLPSQHLGFCTHATREEVHANRMLWFRRAGIPLSPPLLVPSVWTGKLSDVRGPPSAILAYEELPGDRLLHGVGYSFL